MAEAAVVNGMNMISSSRSEEKAAKPKPATAIERLEIVPSKNGGFTATCYKRETGGKRQQLTYTPPDTYTFEGVDKLKAFLDETFLGGPSVTAAEAKPTETEVVAAETPAPASEEDGGDQGYEDTDDDGA